MIYPIPVHPFHRINPPQEGEDAALEAVRGPGIKGAGVDEAVEGTGETVAGLDLGWDGVKLGKIIIII